MTVFEKKLCYYVLRLFEQSKKRGGPQIVGCGHSMSFSKTAQALRPSGEFSKLTRARLQQSVIMYLGVTP